MMKTMKTASMAASVALVLTGTLFAAETWKDGERQALWPEGKIPFFQEKQIAAPVNVVREKGFDPAAHRMPYIEWYRPAASNRTDSCLIIASGGGYIGWVNTDLVQDWLEQFTALGVTCVKFVYRTPRPEGLPFYASAWADGQRAVRLVRAAAKERGFNPDRIGFMSISAGGHLACLLATSSTAPAYEKVDALDETPCNVNLAFAFAPAYVLTDGLGTENAREGDAPDVQLDPIFKFDAQTCPMWFAHGGVDPISPFASTKMYRRLREMKIPAEVHLYPDKDHWAWGGERSVEFMRQMGWLGPLAPEVELMKRFPSDDARDGYSKEDVWPAGKMPDVRTNQCLPYVEWHHPKTLKTKAIQIIYSGGAYMGNGPDSFEVTPARRYLNEKGMTVVTLRYRTPRPAGLQKHVTAWQDLQRTIRIVRSQAAAKGLDPDRIGIMGSSAGGHLTLMGATSSKHRSYCPVDDLDKIPCNVQWAVAIYPAYALTDGADDVNAKGGNPDDARLVPEFSFDLATCPILFVHGDADGYAAMNSVKCWEQLRRMGVQGEVHTLAKRYHCFMVKASPGTGSYTWLDRICEFMTEKGFNR